MRERREGNTALPGRVGGGPRWGKQKREFEPPRRQGRQEDKNKKREKKKALRSLFSSLFSSDFLASLASWRFIFLFLPHRRDEHGVIRLAADRQGRAVRGEREAITDARPALFLAELVGPGRLARVEIPGVQRAAVADRRHGLAVLRQGDAV